MNFITFFRVSKKIIPPPNKRIMKKKLLFIGLLVSTMAMTQRDSLPAGPGRGNTGGGFGNLGLGAARQNPRPYKEIITDKAVSKKGMFTVHKVDDRYYFE